MLAELSFTPRITPRLPLTGPESVPPLRLEIAVPALPLPINRHFPLLNETVPPL